MNACVFVYIDTCMYICAWQCVCVCVLCIFRHVYILVCTFVYYMCKCVCICSGLVRVGKGNGGMQGIDYLTLSSLLDNSMYFQEYILV